MRAKRLSAAIMPLLLLGLVLPPVQDQRIDLELPAAPGGLLDIDLGEVGGDIVISGHDAGTVLIRGTVTAREWRDDNELIIDQSGDTIRVYSEYLENRGRDDNRRMRANLTIRVPRDFKLELTSAMETSLSDFGGRVEVWTGNNDIVARGLSGEARLRVANGNLRIGGSDIEGELSNTNGSLELTGGSFHGELDSTNGGAEIARVSGDLRIAATNGSVTLGEVAGSLTGRTTNGTVRAGTVSGGIRIETINGSVFAALSGAEDIDIETLNGTVELDAPADLSATFELEVRRTEADRSRDRPEIRSDFPLDIAPGEMRGDDYHRSATGSSGAGERRIQVRATNGDVVIRSTR
jgi:hypothetical protein